MAAVGCFLTTGWRTFRVLRWPFGHPGHFPPALAGRDGLPISTKIVEAAIQDALGHCENDAEVAVHLNPEDLKLLKEAGSDLMSDSPHQRRVRYMKDEEVSRGGCLVETSYGLIDGRRETRERLLREAVDA